jgi:DNA-binding CsgD family transcriptional regulator
MLLTAALLGEGWGEALQQLADATEAGGASLVRLQAGRPLAHLSSTDWSEAEAEIIAGRAPRSPFTFYPDQAYGDGFRVDHDVWRDEDMRRDPYFQEFLRPRGVFFHAKIRIWCEPDERISLTLKRRIRFGPYELADVAKLDTVIPELHAVFRVAQRLLDAETSGMLRALHRRGDPLFELDTSGRVLRMHGGDVEHCGLLVRKQRLVAADHLEQSQLERAVSIASGAPRRPALVPFTDARGERRFLQLVPVTGAARDVFVATAAIALVITPSRRPAVANLFAEEIREALSLTAREAEIAALLAEGLSLAEIAERLRLGTGTARNHLKSIFEKSGTGRQGELIALLSKLKP